MSGISKYFSLVKFSHTIFAMPFALIGFFLGMKKETAFPGWPLFLKVMLCMVFARTAAMAFNRYADRKIDALNDRTSQREIPSGSLSASNVLLLVIASTLCFILTAWTINDICFKLSPVALAVVLGYSLTKRFTWLCHFILGLGLSLAPIGAYLAVTGQFDWTPLIFSFIVITWVSGFDVIYALQDEEFDKKNQLFSLPVRFGKAGALRISTAIHFLTASLAIIVCVGMKGTTLQWTGTFIFIGLLIYQHLLVKPNDLSKVNVAFFTTNGLASVIYAGFVVSQLIF